MIEWKLLDSVEQLEHINEDSFASVQAIFKHSTTCPISHMAKSRVESSWNLENVTPYYLDLKKYRLVSDMISSKWGVHHESPQIIVIKNGQSIYDESHLDITIDQINASLSSTDA